MRLIMQTLETIQPDEFGLGGDCLCTHNPPSEKTATACHFCDLDICRLHTSGIGRLSMMISVTMLIAPTVSTKAPKRMHAGGLLLGGFLRIFWSQRCLFKEGTELQDRAREVKRSSSCS